MSGDKGLFGIGRSPGIDLQDFLPPVVSEAIKSTTETILNPDDGKIEIGSPQPAGERPIPVEPGTKEMSSTVQALDSIITLLNAALKMSFLIPDNLEGPIRALVGALGTIRGWLD